MRRFGEWPGLGRRPRAVSEVIEGLVKKGALVRKGPLASWEKRWREVAGPEIAARTKVDRLRKGTLTILCDSSALLAELAGFCREDLLRRLREAGGAEFVRKLDFRLGGVAQQK